MNTIDLNRVASTTIDTMLGDARTRRRTLPGGRAVAAGALLATAGLAARRRRADALAILRRAGMALTDGTELADLLQDLRAHLADSVDAHRFGGDADGARANAEPLDQDEDDESDEDEFEGDDAEGEEDDEESEPDADDPEDPGSRWDDDREDADLEPADRPPRPSNRRAQQPPSRRRG